MATPASNMQLQRKCIQGSKSNKQHKKVLPRHFACCMLHVADVAHASELNLIGGGFVVLFLRFCCFLGIFLFAFCSCSWCCCAIWIWRPLNTYLYLHNQHKCVLVGWSHFVPLLMSFLLAPSSELFNWSNAFRSNIHIATFDFA